jgi:hypothetical protein
MIMSMTVTAAFAYDIAAVNSDGVIIYYSWRDYGGNELAVTEMYGGYFVPGTNDTYSGNVVIPASVKYQNKIYNVTRISYAAFMYCKNLTSVTIPNTVTSIDGGNFQGCTNLTTIKVNSGNPQYDSRDNCNAVIESSTNTLIAGCKATTIPNSVTGIGHDAFRGCSMTAMTIPNSVTTIGYDAFSFCSGLTTVSFPNSVISISPGAFNGCSSLTTVDFGNNVTTIGGDAFRNCTGLASISIPSSVTSIEGGAFYGCTNLNSVSIPNSVSNIGEDAFEGTEWYDDLYNNQSDGVVYIGKVAYTYKGDMPYGTELILKDGTTGISTKAFSGCSGLSSIIIPGSVVFVGNAAFYRCDLTSIIVEEGNDVYDSRNNCNAIIETASNTLVAGCIESVIPNGVTAIGNSAFEGISGNPGPLIIPNGVTTIGERAFRETDFTSVEIPNSVTSIGDYAFNYCYCLSFISIPNSVSHIGESVFDSCYRLTSVKLGKNLEMIKDFAFYDCYRLKDIYCYADKVPDGFSFHSSNKNITLHVPAASLEAYKTSWQWGKFTNIVPLEEIEPLVGSKEITYGGEGNPIHEETDLTDAIIDNTYYSMDTGNGDGYDAESRALVLNSTNTEEQMSTVTDGRVGDDAVRDNYVGIIFELPSWNGRITLDLQTIGSHALYLQLGKDKPMEIVQTVRGTVTIAFNLVKPTYVYLYASSDKADAASRTRGVAGNSVLLYGYKVDFDWGEQGGDANGNGIFDEEDIELVKESILNRADRYIVYDANCDGLINIADIVTINNLMSGKNSCVKVNQENH